MPFPIEELQTTDNQAIIDKLNEIINRLNYFGYLMDDLEEMK
jgi:hypothetical protein